MPPTIDPEKYYIVRTYSAGVFFAKIVSVEGDEVMMNESIKLHYWDGAAAVEQLAVDGTSKPQNCRFTVPVDGSIVKGWIQFLPCTEKAIKSLKGVVPWQK
jgi:hypothetical protein